MLHNNQLPMSNLTLKTRNNTPSPVIKFFINSALSVFAIVGAVILLTAVYHTLVYVAEHL